MHGKMMHMITFILVIVGALNWGLVGAFDFNLVQTIFGAGTVADVIYILVGLSAIVELLGHKKSCTNCTA